MNKNLPVKASLVTREGFQKPMEIPELLPVINIAKFGDPTLVFESSSFPIPDSPIITKMTFYLDKWKEVKQKNGLHHIVAVYREM